MSCPTRMAVGTAGRVLALDSRESIEATGRGMTEQLVAATAVIAATNLNPTVFNQVWLVEHGIVPAPIGEPQPGSVFTDIVVQVQTPTFALLVVPQQLQLAVLPPDVAGQVAHDKIGRIVDLLPHVPYVAVGLNFIWHSDPIAEMGRVGRALFAGAAAPFDHFASPVA
jgi:hypothetical protein